MDIEGQENRRQGQGRTPSGAYEDNGSNTKRYLLIGFVFFILITMARNMMTKDYRQSSKDVLKAGGRDATAVEAYVPKTRAEMLADAKAKNDKINSIDFLQGNITALLERVTKLESQVSTPP